MNTCMKHNTLVDPALGCLQCSDDVKEKLRRAGNKRRKRTLMHRREHDPNYNWGGGKTKVRPCEYYWFECPTDRSAYATAREWFDARFRVDCDQPRTILAQRTGSTNPQFNGPIWVCDEHAGYVEAQNVANQLMAEEQ